MKISFSPVGLFISPNLSLLTFPSFLSFRSFQTVFLPSSDCGLPSSDSAPPSRFTNK